MGTAVNECLAFSDSISATLEKDTALLATIWWRGCETAGHRGETPFLDIRFDENKAHLTEIDLDVAWSVGSDGGKEVL